MQVYLQGGETHKKAEAGACLIRCLELSGEGWMAHGRSGQARLGQLRFDGNWVLGKLRVEFTFSLFCNCQLRAKLFYL
jgi:hypothetical protein